MHLYWFGLNPNNVVKTIHCFTSDLVNMHYGDVCSEMENMWNQTLAKCFLWIGIGYIVWAIVEESGGNITTRFTCSNKSNLLNIDSAVTTRSHCNAVRTFHCFTKSSKPSATLFTAAVQRYGAVYTRPLFAKPRHTCLKLHNVQQVTLHRSHSYMFTTGRTTANSCIYFEPQIIVRFNVTTWFLFVRFTLAEMQNR